MVSVLHVFLSGGFSRADWDRPTGEVTVVGVLKAAERRGKFSPENDRPESRRLLWPEKESLLKAAGLSDKPMILMEAVGEKEAPIILSSWERLFLSFFPSVLLFMLYLCWRAWLNRCASTSSIGVLGTTMHTELDKNCVVLQICGNA